MNYTENDITRANPNEILSWMAHIRRIKGRYFKYDSIYQLTSFINGYVTSQGYQTELGREAVWFVYDQFKTFVSNKYPKEWKKHKCDLAEIYYDLAQNHNPYAVQLYWGDWDKYVHLKLPLTQPSTP